MKATCRPLRLYQNRGEVIDVPITTNQPSGAFSSLVLQVGDNPPIEPKSIADTPSGVLAQFYLPDSHGYQTGTSQYEVRLNEVPDIGKRTLEDGVGQCVVFDEPTPIGD